MTLPSGVDKDQGLIPASSLLPETPDGRLQDLIEALMAHGRVKFDYSFRVITQQFGFQMALLRGLAKYCCEINVLAALTTLFQAR